MDGLLRRSFRIVGAAGLAVAALQHLHHPVQDLVVGGNRHPVGAIQAELSEDGLDETVPLFLAQFLMKPF